MSLLYYLFYHLNIKSPIRMPFEDLSIQVTKDINISIKPSKTTEIDKEKAMYAINWFITKRAWLYKFYNLLAVRSVLNIGGSPFLKANSKEIIQGDKYLNRDVLLIVRYPNPSSFLKLMGNKYFQLISVFRNAAVKDFTFGFASKMSDHKWQKKGENLYYVLHHYQSEICRNDQLIETLENELTDSVKILFSGFVDKDLFVKRGVKEAVKLPGLIDGIVIYQSQDKELLRQTLLNAKYQSIIDSNLKISSLVELSRVF